MGKAAASPPAKKTIAQAIAKKTPKSKTMVAAASSSPPAKGRTAIAKAPPGNTGGKRGKPR